MVSFEVSPMETVEDTASVLNINTTYSEEIEQHWIIPSKYISSTPFVNEFKRGPVSLDDTIKNLSRNNGVTICSIYGLCDDYIVMMIEKPYNRNKVLKLIMQKNDRF